MRLERGNLVRITDDEVKIAKFKEEGYKEVEKVNEEKTDKEVEEVNEEKKAKEAEVAEADKEAKEAEVAKEKAEEKKTTGRGRANNKK